MKNTIYFDAEFAPLLLVNEEQVGSNSIVINIEADSTANQSLLITMDSGTTTSLTVTPGQENSLAIDEEYWSLSGSTFVSLVKGGLTSNSITLIFPETINTDAALEETSNLTYTMTGSNTVTEQIDNLDDRVTALEQGGGGNVVYTSVANPDSTLGNEGDLWVKYFVDYNDILVNSHGDEVKINLPRYESADAAYSYVDLTIRPQIRSICNLAATEINAFIKGFEGELSIAVYQLTDAARNITVSQFPQLTTDTYTINNQSFSVSDGSGQIGWSSNPIHYRYVGVSDYRYRPVTNLDDFNDDLGNSAYEITVMYYYLYYNTSNKKFEYIRGLTRNNFINHSYWDDSLNKYTSDVTIDLINTSFTTIDKIYCKVDNDWVSYEGDGGSTVVVNQILQSGTEIAQISVDGEVVSVYAPSSNKMYTSTRIPTSSDTANEGDLWYQMNYVSSDAFDFPDWGYTLPLEYNPGSFKLSDVRSSLELRFYDTVNDIYLYYLFLGGTNYTIAYNRLGPTNTFDGFDKDTGELQVTTENSQGTAWSYWNYIPRWDGRSSYHLIANPLEQGESDSDMSPVIGTATYNLYSILGYADEISSGTYRLDGFRLITDGVESSWQHGGEREYNILTRWVYKENNWQTADYIAGEGVTIKNGIISANGSAIVQVNPIVTSGTQLATINGTGIYAPTTTVTQTLTEGTEIAQINNTPIYAPTGGGSDVTVTPKTSTGTNIADIEVDGTTYQLFAPSGGGGEAIETAFIYSNEERVVGVWTDNKPLYQKNVYIGVLTYDTSWHLLPHNISGLGEVVKVYGRFKYLGDGMWYEFPSTRPNQTTSICVGCNTTNLQYMNNWLPDTQYASVTIQYTKSTDTPGSGPYVTNGSYAHHYSTTEQVIGTWIDGKPIYEITYELATTLTINSTSYIHSGITPANIKSLIGMPEIIDVHGQSAPIMAGIYSSNKEIALAALNTVNGSIDLKYLIVRYTKTTD